MNAHAKRPHARLADLRKSLLACAIAAALGTTAAHAVHPFDSPTRLTAGTHPRVLVRADLFGKGQPIHLVTANEDSDDLTVFINDGNGNYSAQRVPVGKQPRRINVVDLDNDGKPDLAVLNRGDRTIQLMVNDGKGGFVSSGTVATGTDPDRQISWKSAQNSRLVVSNSADNTISYHAFGAGGGAIGSKVVGVGKRPTALQNLDLDGDGVDELLVLNFDDATVSIVEREGGAAALPIGVTGTVTVGEGPTATSAPVDVDGDGKRDIIVANQISNTISALRSRGDRTFDVMTYAVGAGPSAVATADLNADGRPDLIVANGGANSISVLLNEGNGVFGRAVEYAVGSGPGFPVVSDMDGDGIADLTIPSANEGAVTVLKGAVDGTFTPLARLALGSSITGRGSAQVVDVAWNGNPGIAVALPNAHAVGLIGNLNGGFTRVIEYARTRPDGKAQYFMTPVKAEIEALDKALFPGWGRTGASFRAYARWAADRNAVCRFFAPSLDSHFYSPFAEECEFVATELAATWGAPESDALFYIPVSVTGTCPSGFTAVYRLYNPATVNHRHTTNKQLRDASVNAGWVSEGTGNDGVAMCAP